MDNTTHTGTAQTRRRFQRPRQGRVVAGVSGALADRFNLSIGLVRLAFVVATLFGGAGLIGYAAGWLLIESEGESRSLATRWAQDLRTPGRVAPAILTGVLGAFVLAALTPLSLLAALLLATAAIVVLRRDTHPSTN
jgi:phage shock protein PspC (stress-responsive transcriptional regulator)